MDREDWILEQLYSHVTENKKELFAQNIELRTKHVTVVLENIFQPHNAAAVLRSCDCFGIQDVHIIENTNRFSPNREIDMGSSKWLSIHRHNETDNNSVATIRALKAKGFRIAATTPAENDLMIGDLPLDQPTALLFGTELTGLTQEALDEADCFVKLPMYGFTESYNISVSVALALYAVRENLMKSTIPWQLTQLEKRAILTQWAKKVVKDGQKLEAIYNERFPG